MEIQLETAKVLIDDADFDKIKDKKWYLNPNGYAITFYAIKKPNGKQSTKVLFLHRELMQPKNTENVDHINNNKLDNRRCNLRICTKSQNLANKPGRRNGYKGVSPRETNYGIRYLAYISMHGKRHNLGSYSTEEQAALAYNIAAKKIHGEFAYLNDVKLKELPEDAQCIYRTQEPYFGIKKEKRSKGFSYQVSIIGNGKYHYLGTFSTLDKAINAYNNKSKELGLNHRNKLLDIKGYYDNE